MTLICNLAIGFLPGKTEEVYVELFEELRQCLIDEFGNTGCAKIVLLDREVAAHNAIRDVFPEWTTKSCNFHFVKNVQDYAKNNGLITVLTDEAYWSWLNAIIGNIFEFGYS